MEAEGASPPEDIEAWLPRYIVRQTGARHVQRVAGQKRRAPKSVREIADDVKLRYEMKIWHRDKATGRWEKKRVRYGFCQIYWPVTEKVYTLVVAVGLGKDPLLLWTNLKVRGDATAQFVVRAFLRRWAVEDCGRVIKQEFKLEKVRVEGWVSIRRSIILAGLAYDFLCSIGRLGKTILEFITSQVRAFRAVKKVIAYRVRQGLAKLWRDGLLDRPSNFG